jgi:hypothetical protein
VSDTERIDRLIRDLYRIVADLEEIAPGRRFTPDGHVVGTIGELVAAERFGLKLMPASPEGYDALTNNFCEEVATPAVRHVCSVYASTFP